MADVMTQTDLDRKEQLVRLPAMIADAARPLHAVLVRHDSAVAARVYADAQHPDFVSPPALQRLGYYIRAGIYPANFLAELLAGAATATYLAVALLRVGDERIWLAPLVFATVVLATEMGVARMREEGRMALHRAPLGWTVAALVILVTLIGLQVTSQLVEALDAAFPGEPDRVVSDLEWFDWARVGFFCTVTSVLHAAVLFGGRAQENALAYAIFRVNRRLTGARIWWHGGTQRAATAELSALVTAYDAHRRAHAARGFDPGPPPVFDAMTRAMLERMARQPVSAANTAATPAPAAAPATAAAAATPPAPASGSPDGPVTPANASGDGASLEDENAYLRAALDARMRNDDGEVQPLAG